MTTKEKLTQNIKKWLQNEKEMKILQKELKERRAKKVEYSLTLVELMKNNEIDCVDINEGKIMYTQNKVKNTINKKHLMECMEKYFSNEPDVQPDEIVKFILDNRTTNIKDVIRHKPPKIVLA
jgi:hypothetical protein